MSKWMMRLACRSAGPGKERRCAGAGVGPPRGASSSPALHARRRVGAADSQLAHTTAGQALTGQAARHIQRNLRSRGEVRAGRSIRRAGREFHRLACSASPPGGALPSSAARRRRPSAPTLCPRLYQVTRPAIRLRVKLPPSQSVPPGGWRGRRPGRAVASRALLRSTTRLARPPPALIPKGPPKAKWCGPGPAHTRSPAWFDPAPCTRPAGFTGGGQQAAAAAEACTRGVHAHGAAT